MTTWRRHDFAEGILFSIFAVNDGKIMIDKLVILDMTSGKEKSRKNYYWFIKQRTSEILDYGFSN